MATNTSARAHNRFSNLLIPENPTLAFLLSTDSSSLTYLNIGPLKQRSRQK
jgi:hypothetical protein